jgi:hypothetical protein
MIIDEFALVPPIIANPFQDPFWPKRKLELSFMQWEPVSAKPASTLPPQLDASAKTVVVATAGALVMSPP